MGVGFPVCAFPGKGRQGLILAGWSEELAWRDPSFLRCAHPFRSLSFPEIFCIKIIPICSSLRLDIFSDKADLSRYAGRHPAPNWAGGKQTANPTHYMLCAWQLRPIPYVDFEGWPGTAEGPVDRIGTLSRWAGN